MPTQLKLIELYERARLIGEFPVEGIYIALPIDGGSIAMLASLDPCVGSRYSQWVPVHVVATNTAAEFILRGSDNISVTGLVIAVAARAAKPKVLLTYAFTPAEWIVVSERAGAMAVIETAMEPYAVAPGQWRRKLKSALDDFPSSSRAVVELATCR